MASQLEHGYTDFGEANEDPFKILTQINEDAEQEEAAEELRKSELREDRQAFI